MALSSAVSTCDQSPYPRTVNWTRGIWLHNCDLGPDGETGKIGSCLKKSDRPTELESVPRTLFLHVFGGSGGHPNRGDERPLGSASCSRSLETEARVQGPKAAGTACQS